MVAWWCHEDGQYECQKMTGENPEILTDFENRWEFGSKTRDVGQSAQILSVDLSVLCRNPNRQRANLLSSFPLAQRPGSLSPLAEYLWLCRPSTRSQDLKLSTDKKSRTGQILAADYLAHIFTFLGDNLPNLLADPRGVPRLCWWVHPGRRQPRGIHPAWPACCQFCITGDRWANASFLILELLYYYYYYYYYNYYYKVDRCLARYSPRA